MVQDLEAARARHEVDAIAADVGVRVALAVEQGERARRGLDRLLDDIAGEEDPAVRVLGQAVSRRRWRRPAPRTSMPTSARIRFASSRMRAMRSGSSIEMVGRMGLASIRLCGGPPEWIATAGPGPRPVVTENRAFLNRSQRNPGQAGFQRLVSALPGTPAIGIVRVRARRSLSKTSAVGRIADPGHGVDTYSRSGAFAPSDASGASGHRRSDPRLNVSPMMDRQNAMVSMEGEFMSRAPGASDRGRTARAAAFADLVDRRALDSAYRFATLMLGDRGDAEDATHDAAVMAWRHFGELRDPHRFEAWFGRILVERLS